MSQFAVVAFPQTDDLEQIEAVRRRFDPQAALIAAHITLVFPFQADLAADALRLHIEQALEGMSAVRVQLTGVRVSGEEYLYLEVGAGRDTLLAIHARLYTGPLARHLRRDVAYEPHVTLARCQVPDVLALAQRESAATLSVSNATIGDLAVFHVERPNKGRIAFTVPLSYSA